MYEVAPSPDVVDAAVRGRTDFAGLVRELVARARGSRAGRRPDQPTWSADASSTDDEVVASVGAAAQRRPRGVGQRLRQRPGRDAAPRPAARPTTRSPTCVEEMLRFDSALQLFERTATAARSRSAASSSRPGQKIAALLGRGQPRPGRLRPTPTSSTSAATPTRTSPSASACTSASARRWPGWSWRSRSRRCSTASPAWRWRASRRAGGTFVLRGSVACQSGVERWTDERRVPRRRRGDHRQARRRAS